MVYPGGGTQDSIYRVHIASCLASRPYIQGPGSYMASWDPVFKPPGPYILGYGPCRALSGPVQDPIVIKEWVEERVKYGS